LGGNLPGTMRLKNHKPQLVPTHRETTNYKLSKTETIIAFGAKVLMGCLYGYLFLHYYGGDDTWVFHQTSLVEYNKLVHTPALFLKDLLPISAIEGSSGGWQAFHFYIMDLEHWLIPKLLALFNIISRGNYYINCVFFNLILFWGHYWLFSLLTDLFPNKRKPLFLLIFLFPPVLFWLSGIRADGLLFFFIALLLLHFHRWVTTRRSRSLVYVLLALTGILIFRDVLVLLLLPALTAWFIVVRYKRKPAITFAVVYGIMAILFFSTTLITDTANLPAMVVKRQQQYFRLAGNTRFPLDSLQANPLSFIQLLPQSVNNTFFRPYLWEAKGPLQLATALDILFFWMVVLWCFVKKDIRWKEYFQHPLLWVLLFFSISLYLFIGYTVPFPGAIVRYKMIAALFLYAVFFVVGKFESPKVRK
jgi:hypothetical protein